MNMFSKLQGIDANGRHAANWGKLDTSSIKVPALSINEKSTNYDAYNAMCASIREMLTQAVDVIYGDEKQKKYIKIVDMLMLRIRGALQKLNEQNEKKIDEVNENLETVLESFHAKIEKLIEEHDSQLLKSNSLIFQELQSTIIQKIEEQCYSSDSNDESTGEKQKNSKQQFNETSSESIQKFENLTNANSFEQNICDLLVGLQKQVLTGFARIESLIKSNDVQKNAENAVANTEKSIDQQIVNRQKKNEGDVKKQIGSLNSKAMSDLDSSFSKKDIKDEKDDGKKSKKKKKKKKDSDLKNAMTGKQFNMLRNLLSRQFDIVVEISEQIIKRMNKRFVQINKRIDKLIQDRTKNGFSWGKLLFFLSFFIIPLLWSKITDFFKDGADLGKINEKIDNIIQNFDVGKYIDVDKLAKYVDDAIKRFADNFDFKQFITDTSQQIWDWVKKQFNEFVENPIGTFEGLIKDAFEKMTAWVTDMWNWVKGNDPTTDKAKKEIDKERKSQLSEHEHLLDQEVKKIEEKTSAETKKLTDEGEKHEQAMTTSMNNAQTSIDASTEKLNNKTNSIHHDATKTDTELDNISSNSLATVNSQIKQIEDNLTKEVNNVTDAQAKDIRNEANKIDQKIRREGAPTQYTREMVEKAERDVDSLNENAEPNIEILKPVKHYTFVEETTDKGTRRLLTTRDEVNKQLEKIQSNENVQTSSVKAIQNAIKYGTFTDAELSENDKKLVQRERKERTIKLAMEGEITPQKFFDEAAIMYDKVNEAYEVVSNGLNDISETNKKSYDLLEEIKNKLEPSLDSVSDALNELSDLKPEINSAITIQVNANKQNATDAEMTDN